MSDGSCESNHVHPAVSPAMGGRHRLVQILRPPRPRVDYREYQQASERWEHLEANRDVSQSGRNDRPRDRADRAWQPARRSHLASDREYLPRCVRSGDERRGHRIVRYADDILILCASRSGAEHALQVATEILEGTLKLTVNREKTHLVEASQGVKFLGVQIHTSWTGIQDKKINAFKAKVKAITRRNSPVNLTQVIDDLNPVLRGFANYFRMANCQAEFRDLSVWIRRRLRQKQLSDWKKPSRLHRRLRQLGYQGEFPRIRMRSWRSSRSPQANFAVPNAWLTDLGLYDIASVESGVLPKFT